MKYKGYNIDSKYIKDGKLDWSVWHTPNGSMVIGTKGSDKYLIKRNENVKKPRYDMPDESKRLWREKNEAHEKKQNKLLNAMKSFSMESNHIVNELEHFWEDEGYFTTVTKLVPDVLPDSTDLSKLSKEQFINLIRQTAIFLKDIHSKGVIHGDLKLKNIVLSKYTGTLTPYLIDFDSSYPASEIPEHDKIVGTDKYRSPELAYYTLAEGEAPSTIITPATDIFTLAIIWHQWWTNSFPGFSDDYEELGCAVYCNEEIEINKKFDAVIGENNGATIISLINWMFVKDHTKRPTAEQVISVLNDEAPVPVEYHIGADAKPFDTEVWGTHKLAAKLVSEEEIKAKGIKYFKRINVGGGTAGYKYNAIYNDGTEKVLSIDELYEMGIANRIAATITDAWPEHRIEFVDPLKLSSLGVAKIEKVILFNKKRYNITTVTGHIYDRNADFLVSKGYATPIIIEVNSDNPWPEHGIAYNHERLSAAGIKKINRVEICGEHRYDYEKEDGTIINGAPANNIIFLGFIKRK